MLKRAFDLISSTVALFLLSPIFILVSILISISSKGGPFFFQKRIGKNEKPFTLIKFRTMRIRKEADSQITIGERDSRVTSIGYFLRKYKLDELPQLLNILLNHMSIVGPRPEVEKYVKMYNSEQKKVLAVKPGLTDLASLEYIDESRLLGESKDPESTYIQEIMPKKLELNLEYIKQQSFLFDLKIIFSTIKKIFD